jgi:hypothetical protein
MKKNTIKQIIVCFAFIAIALNSTAQSVQMIANITNANGSDGDNGLAINATFGNKIPAMVKDSKGNIYIADAQKNNIRKIDAITGIITTIAGKPIWTSFQLPTFYAIDAHIPYP